MNSHVCFGGKLSVVDGAGDAMSDKSIDPIHDGFSVLPDIANWTWVSIHYWAGVDVDDLPHLKRWMALMAAKPACQKGILVPEPFEPEKTVAMAKKIVK